MNTFSFLGKAQAVDGPTAMRYDRSMSTGRTTASGEALARFLASTAEAVELLDDVPDGAWQARPSGEPWSLADTVEHLVLANRGTLARLKAPTTAAGDAELVDDAAINERMFHDAPAPPPGLAEPTGAFATRADGLAALTAVRDAIVVHVRTAGDGLRDLRLPHPVFGLFDGLQWVLFAAAHTDNHLPQLRRLRAAAG
jgi:hypothetical protein